MSVKQQTRPHFRPIITEIGLQRLMTAAQSGAAVTISHVALGDTGWLPTASATELQHECYRTAISGTRRMNDTQQNFTFIVQGDREYWIKEMGLILDDGTLFAVWSDTEHPLAWKAANVNFLLGYDLVLTGLPSDNIVIEANNELNLAPATQVYRGILRLATQEEANALSLDDVALTPATLPQASQAQLGIARFADNEAAQAGILTDVAMTPNTTRSHGDERYTQKKGDYTDLRARATTKADVGLGSVPNYSCTGSVSDPSNRKFATAGAVKKAYDKARSGFAWGGLQYSAWIDEYANFIAPAGCVIVGKEYDKQHGEDSDHGRPDRPDKRGFKKSIINKSSYSYYKVRYVYRALSR